MTCGEVREILFAFLDNELDASLSIEVQRHIEHCPDCACEVETERTIQKRLAATMEQDGLDAQTLDEQVREIATAHRHARAKSRVWSGVIVAAAAVFLIAVVAWRHLGLTGPASDHEGLASMLVEDFDHFVSEGRPVQLATSDRGEVSRWLSGKTGLSVSVPGSKGHCKLVGARKCKETGKVACALYEMAGEPAALAVLPATPDSIEGMQRLSVGGRDFWVEQVKDHSIVAFRRNDVLYAAVSRTERDALIHFMSELE